ncbi:MAG TPA: ABC transporter permease, partial [Candidatus Limnocylindrales bacterium]|nr:ABC transporter permease [Candidatus Limnocylindrales bacterium]
LLFVLLWILSPAFRSPTSLAILMMEAAAIGIVAAGQTMVILTGGIDLSVEAMVSFAGVVAAILISGSSQAGGQNADGIPSWAAILIALAVGAAIGLLQGAIIAGLRINPFIVTLGFRSILLGVALVWTRGAGINIGKDDFLGFLTDFITIPLGPLASILGLDSLRIPMPFLIALVIYFIVWVVLRHTKFGRYTYAIGGNETAARLSGVNVSRTTMLIYACSGLLAAVSGVLVMGRLQSGAYQNGTNMTLISVAAVVIGGTALSGGVGGIWGTMVGVLIIRIVEQGLIYLNVPSNAKEIVIGAIIVIAVALDVVRRGDVRWLNFGRRRKAR